MDTSFYSTVIWPRCTGYKHGASMSKYGVTEIGVPKISFLN